MKKITALLLAALMTLSLAACKTEPKKTTYEKYREAYDKTSALAEQDARMTMDMNMAMQGMTIHIPMVTDLQLRRDADAVTEAAMSVSMEVMGTEQKTSAYYFDGYMYYDMGTMKYKQAISPEELTGQGINTETLLLGEENMTAAQERAEGGATVIDVTVDGNAVKEQLMNFVGGDLGSLVGAGEVPLEDIVISDVAAGFTIGAEGYFTRTDMQFSVTLPVTLDASAGTTAEVACDIDILIEYRNPGQPVTITPPDALDSFADLSLVMQNGGQMTAEQEAAVSELLTLYDPEQPVPLENYDEGFAALVEKYGPETMAYADQYVQYLVTQFNVESAASASAGE